MSEARVIGDLLRRQKQLSGGRVFLRVPGGGASLTFGQVYDSVTDLSAQLRAQGVAAGDRVAVLLPNGIAASLAILAVLSAGGVVVPLNHRLTGDEIRQALDLSQCGALIGEVKSVSGIREVLGGAWNEPTEASAWGLEGTGFFRKTDGEEGRQVVNRAASEHDPALILFTSGTTGMPKGVVLSRSNLLANAGFVRDAHDLTDRDTALCLLPLFHINGLVVTLLAPLVTGMTVVMPPRFDVVHFWEWVREYRVTWFSAVPTILSLLLSHPDPPAAHLATLRFARSASAPLPVAVLEEFERRFGVPVIETYGISEAACQVTANPLPPKLRKPGSAGVPVGNRLQIVDHLGHPLAQGAVGEVVVRGNNVFAGYLDNPAADREALRDGWFYTGDLGYLDAEGYLFLTGRKKELINRAGEKISPREVEEVVHRLPEVETVGVVGVPHQLYGEEVTAFITLRHGSELSVQRVRDFCREHLAGFKVPREVFFIAEFPRGPSGKVQRRRLLEVYAQLKERQVHHETYL